MSVASVLTAHDHVCKDVRIVLGGVAPEPVRAKKAEGVIRGRSLDGKRVAEAAETAVEDATPLTMNEYKVQITKALVRRALLA